MKYFITKKISLFFLFLIAFLFLAQGSLADNPKPSNHVKNEIKDRNINIFLDKATIARGYTVKTEDDYLKLSLVPGILSEDTRVLIEKIPDGTMLSPWGLKKESPTLQFEFVNKSAYDNSRPFYIQLSYDEKSLSHKQVFFYDGNHRAWRPLPTRDFPSEKFVRSLIHLPFARIAVFSYDDVMGNGVASWYKHKGGNFAASPDFPKGSILRVRNLDNDKFVDVEINDYGPNRKMFPDRVIDLDYEAFKKIADKKDGLINVSIEPLRVVADNFGRELGIGISRGSSPEISSKAAILYREKDGQIFLNKNPDEVLPIASLTKIVSVFTFLEQGNNRDRLDEIINYKIGDEEYNHQYFNKWEVARVNMNNDDLFSIKDAVYSSMVRSANNTVESLVRVSGLNREDFINRMNSWAKDNEAESFHAFEPTGLDEKNVASARDLVKLAKIIFDDPIMRESSTATSYRFFTRNDNSLKLRYNSSDLVLNNNYKNFKITGSKTGYLAKAGYCLITRAEVNGENFLIVVLGSSTRANSFRETIDLFNYAYHLTN